MPAITKPKCRMCASFDEYGKAYCLYHDEPCDPNDECECHSDLEE